MRNDPIPPDPGEPQGEPSGDQSVDQPVDQPVYGPAPSEQSPNPPSTHPPSPDAREQYAREQYAQGQYAQGQVTQGQYAQGQYAQAPYGAPPQQQIRSDGNAQVYGILGIVLGLVTCPPVGVLLGWLSIREARARGQSEALGKVALWLGVALTALVVLSGLCAMGAIIVGSTMDNPNFQ